VQQLLYKAKHIVAYLLKARTVEPQKQPLLGNGCVTHDNGVAVGNMFSVRLVLRLYNKHQLPLQGSLQIAIRRVGSWREMATSLQGHDPRSRGTFTGEDTADLEDLVCAVVNCRVCKLATVL
jgi:hypothetical protein